MKKISKVFLSLFISLVFAVICLGVINFGTNSSEPVTDASGSIVNWPQPNEDVVISKPECDITMTAIGKNSIYFDDERLQYISVPSSMMTFECNGESTDGHPLSYAYDDGNWLSFWQSKIPNTDGFKNKITVTFTKQVELDCILYQGVYSSNKDGYGFPQKLNINADTGNGKFEPVGSSELIRVDENCDYRIKISFRKTISCTRIEFEFDTLCPSSGGQATAVGMQFCQPYHEDVFKVGEMFANYNRTELLPEFQTHGVISDLRKKVENMACYDTLLKVLLDRADGIMDGTFKFDYRREFSTDPNTSSSYLAQVGDIRGYAGNVLKMASLGTNRQVTGIAGNTGSTITIYVDAEPSDPLPKVAFTQIHGDWRRWKDEFELHIGTNTFTFPNFITSDYSVDTNPGGPIYLINPYDPSKQSSNVKVYIDGGYFIPTFKLGQNEGSFLRKLDDYVKLMDSDTENYVDAAEVVTNHTIMTMPAREANDVYKKYSVVAGCNNWMKFMTMYLEFDGVTFDKNNPRYNLLNEYLNINIRRVQPWGGASAFAAGDHVGLIENWSSYIYSEDGSRGWGMAHEIGHALDTGNGRTWAEVTNNVYSVFDIEIFEHGWAQDKAGHMRIMNELSSDRDYQHNLWSGGATYSIWWEICGRFPTFWGDLNNVYRQNPIEYDSQNKCEVIGTTEKMVYFASLATHIDMSYYFERWGFYMNGERNGSKYAAYDENGVEKTPTPFTYEGASSKFKELMIEARKNGKFDKSPLKFWYMDNVQYRYIDEYYYAQGISMENWAGIYGRFSQVGEVRVLKDSGGYTLVMPTVNDFRHLGYEIQEYNGGDWQVIGFTTQQTFTDTHAYPHGYEPRYKVVAYDRLLCASAESRIYTYSATARTGECLLNGERYATIGEAVAAASENDTIYLLSNICDSGVIIDKSLTIMPYEEAGSDVVLQRGGAGAMLQIKPDVTLTLKGAAGRRLVLDGGSFTQTGTIVSVGGKLIVSGGVTFQNNYSSNNGGAILLTEASGRFEISDAEFINNHANNGGVFANLANGSGSFTGCKFINNSASAYGGAIYNSCLLSSFSNCVFESNSATNGGAICNYNGGVIYNITGSTFMFNNATVRGGAMWLDGRTDISASKIISNSAGEEGGGIYYSGSNTARVLNIMENSELTYNTANLGGALFIAGSGKVRGNGSTDVGALMTVYGNKAGEGSAIYHYSSEFRLSGNSKIAGEIMLVSQSMVVHDKIFSGEAEGERLHFKLKNIAEGAVLFNTTFDVESDNLDSLGFVSDSGMDAFVSNEAKRTVLVSPHTFTITLLFDEQSQTVEGAINSEFIIPDFDGFTTKYVISWMDQSGIIYHPGESIMLRGSLTLKAQLGDKIPITLHYYGKMQTIYIKPNSLYFLPSTIEDNGEVIDVLYWKNNSKVYYPNDSLVVMRAASFSLFTNNGFTVEFLANGEAYYSQNFKRFESAEIKYPTVPEGYRFDYLEIDGTRYNEGDTFVVTRDTTVNAHLVKLCSVTYEFNGKTETEVVDENTEIVLKAPANSRNFKHYLINGEIYNIGDKVVITSDTIIIAVYDNGIVPLVLMVGAILIMVAVTITIIVLVSKSKKKKA